MGIERGEKNDGPFKKVGDATLIHDAIYERIVTCNRRINQCCGNNGAPSRKQISARMRARARFVKYGRNFKDRLFLRATSLI